MNEDKAKQLYEEFIRIQEEAEQLESHRKQISDQLASIRATQETLGHLETLEKPTQSWVAIAPGAYTKATLQPQSPILLNVGAGAAVEKTPDQVRQTLKAHERALGELRDAAEQELGKAIERLEQIRTAVQTSTPEPKGAKP